MSSLTNEQLDALFADPGFRTRMFQFIQTNFDIKVDVSAEGQRVRVAVELHGTTDFNRRREYLIGDSDSDSIYLD